MTARFVTALTLGAALLVTAPAGAASKADAATSADAGTKRTPYIGWAGLGFYDISGSAYFGLHLGGSVNLVQLTNDLPLIGWGDFGLAFGSETAFPLSAGVGVRYDKAGPVQLLGGVGFAVLPHTGGGSTPVGVRLMGTLLYPLPKVSKNLSAQTQLSFDILSESTTMFAWTVGVGYAL
jgi:hypothetical protein